LNGIGLSISLLLEELLLPKLSMYCPFK
jgi:hypothetical protein